MDNIKSQKDKLTKFPYFQILDWMYKDLYLSGNALVIFEYIFSKWSVISLCIGKNKNFEKRGIFKTLV